MPFYTVTTSILMNKVQKRDVIYGITELTIKLLNIAPDKIQVTIHTSEKESLGRAGVTLDNENFSEDSRLVQWEPKKSYYNDSSRSEDMVIIELDIWDSFNVEQKEILVKEINEFFIKKFNLSGDNILILVRDMIPSNWTQNGIIGGKKEFLEKSRSYK
ncbi:tautomerase family protein [Clostridium sp.]|uniref:tautomerase family protein n=1 Tax=Clostridium sp. TaxID=1506 RepID=UPI00260566E2|nr:tautomerase family protein [Clostridium sp.]